MIFSEVNHDFLLSLSHTHIYIFLQKKHETLHKLQVDERGLQIVNASSTSFYVVLRSSMVEM